MEHRIARSSPRCGGSAASRLAISTSIVTSVLLAAGGLAHAQDVASFYRGKTVQIICGFGAGGGYDLYARLLSRHIGDHIPGNPGVIVQNMTGAGSVRASNHVYNAAAKDGTVIAAVNQNMPMYSLLGGKSAQFDAAKLRWLGSMASSNGVLYTWHTSSTKTIDDAMKRETVLGGTGTNSDSHIFPTLINKLLGTKFKVINGYSGGTAQINLALERGEVEGRGGNTWASLKSGNAQWIAEKKLNYIVQIGFEREPELGDTPLLGQLVKNPEDRKAVDVISLPTVIGYAHWMAPDIPDDRFAAMRAAYAATLKDKAFLDEAKKIGALIAPKTGEALEKLVRDATSTPKPLLERTARLLDWQAK